MFQVKDKTTGIVFYKIPESHCVVVFLLLTLNKLMQARLKNTCSNSKIKTLGQKSINLF